MAVYQRPPAALAELLAAHERAAAAATSAAL